MRRLKAEMNWDIWRKSQKAIYKKVEFKKANYSKSEKSCILKLKIALKNVFIDA